MRGTQVFAALVISGFGFVSEGRADDGRQAEFARCMQRVGNQSFCNCRIIVNPHYRINNMFIKVIAAQHCDQEWGHSLYGHP